MHYKTIQINKKTVRLHRYLMEQELGRKISFNEIVHHKDGNKLNNDINNLKLVTRAEHILMHPNIKVAAIKSKKKYYINHDFLYDLYVNKDFTKKEISKKLHIPYGTINWYTSKHNIKHKKRPCHICNSRVLVMIKTRTCKKCYEKEYRLNVKNSAL